MKKENIEIKKIIKKYIKIIWFLNKQENKLEHRENIL